MSMGKLHGRTALITGGSSGIGRAIAVRFLHEGAHVTITGRDAEKLRRTAEELAGDGPVHHVPCDVADPEAVRGLVATATRDMGRIDILVNNAGLNLKQRALRELTVENWQLLIRANLDGAFYCIHEVLPQMLERRDGVIINISSIAGKRASPLGGAAYSASKFGMSALSLCLGLEEKDSGIRCSVIYPGEVDTPILEHRPQPVTAEQRRRILKPEDVAEAALFVAALPARVSIPELIIKPTSQAYA